MSDGWAYSDGIYPARLPATATSEAAFDEVYAVNVKAPFFLVAAIAPAMAERGGGAIINLAPGSSASGTRPPRSTAPPRAPSRR